MVSLKNSSAQFYAVLIAEENLGSKVHIALLYLAGIVKFKSFLLTNLIAMDATSAFLCFLS